MQEIFVPLYQYIIEAKRGQAFTRRSGRIEKWDMVRVTFLVTVPWVPHLSGCWKTCDRSIEYYIFPPNVTALSYSFIPRMAKKEKVSLMAFLELDGLGCLGFWFELTLLLFPWKFLQRWEPPIWREGKALPLWQRIWHWIKKQNKTKLALAQWKKSVSTPRKGMT